MQNRIDFFLAICKLHFHLAVDIEKDVFNVNVFV